MPRKYIELKKRYQLENIQAFVFYPLKVLRVKQHENWSARKTTQKSIPISKPHLQPWPRPHHCI